MFDFGPVYSGERFRASGPSCFDNGHNYPFSDIIYNDCNCLSDIICVQEVGSLVPFMEH